MVFSSLSFLFLFMPIVIMLYYLLPPFLRNGLLFITSLFFYAWGEPGYLWIMLFSTVFDYTNGRLLEYFSGQEGKRKLIVWISILGNLGILGFFKYYGFAIKNLNTILGTDFYVLNLALPIGISFYTFQTMSYTIDVYRDKVKAQHNIIDFGMYVCLFPQLIAGPIVRYEHIAHEISSRAVTAEDRVEGFCRFCRGLGKKVILANQIGSLWEMIHKTADRSLGLAWIGALAFTFQIYFDFSGYSDMAIGLGRMLGFHFPENFDHPYEAKSITEFWRKWHMTMGQWFREYVYIPLGGNRCAAGRQIWNLFIVWSLTGLWHGAGWNFVLWGWFYGILLILEKFLYGRWLKRLPAILQHAYTLFFVVSGWMLFAADSIKDGMQYLGQMCGVWTATNLWDQQASFYLLNYGFLFFVLIAASGTFQRKVWGRLCSQGQKQSVFAGISLGYAVGILIISLVFLIGDAYNPFLYFRF